MHLPPDTLQGLCPNCVYGELLDGSNTEPRVALPLSRPRDASGLPEPASSSVLGRLAGTIGEVPHVLSRDSDVATGPGPILRPSSSEMPEPAQRPDKYQLFGEIARGGMGAVLKGRDVDLGRDLALKVLLESHMDNPDLIRRFVEEAQIGGQLQHPGVVPIYELGTFADQRPFFTMKLVKGRTLAAMLAERKPVGWTPSTENAPAVPNVRSSPPFKDLPRFLSIFESICQTMAYAHVRGVIHRDLKPSNIMVGNFGEVQVMDWGLAKVLPQGGAVDDEVSQRAEPEPAVSVIRTARSGSDADASHAGSVLGTPGYMAPEQARGEIDLVDERSDVFGLGAILCEILTGQPAFVGRTSAETLRTSGRGELADAFARLDQCGAEPKLIDLTRHCLAPERNDRPRQASVVSARIDGYLTGVQERLRKAELASVEDRARRRLTMAVAASILGLMVLGGGGWAWVVGERRSRAERFTLAFREAQALNREAEAAGDDLSRWAAARGAAQRVQLVLADAPDAAMRAGGAGFLTAVIQAGARAESDQELLAKLVDARSGKADDPDGSATDAAYAQAFRDAGINITELSPEKVGDRIRGRPGQMALALAAFLDDWAEILRLRRADAPGAHRISAAARRADPDHERNQLRGVLDQLPVSARTAALRRAAQQTDIDVWPAVNLSLLGVALLNAGDYEAAEKVLRHGQHRNPRDVWLNYELARCLEKLARRDEAIRYYAAARAIRPETAHEFAHALEAKGERDEAIVVFQDLVRMRPMNVRHLSCFGRTLLARGRTQEGEMVLDGAIAACRRAIQLNPNDVDAYNALGLALRSRGKPQEAIDAYLKALRIAPGFFAVHLNLGIALDDQGKVAEAAAAYRQAIRFKPDFAEAHNNLGDALSKQGMHTEACVEHREAIRLNPESAEAHNNLGNALSRQGKLVEAIAAYREAIRLKPDDVAAHLNLGDIWYNQGKLTEAIGSFRAAIHHNPGLVEAYLKLGNSMRAEGKPEEAITAYREAIRLKPELAEAHVCLGALLCDVHRDYDGAIAQFRMAIGLNPNDASAHCNLGVALGYQGSRAEAVVEFREAIRLAPDRADFLCNLGSALDDQGNFTEAVAAYREAIRLKPDVVDAHNSLGAILCDSMQDYGGAIVEFREVIGLEPDAARAHYNLGNALYGRGMPVEAAAAYRKAIQLRPDHAEAHNNFGNALKAQHKVPEAIAEYRETIRLNPILIQAHSSLADALRELGRTGEAIAAYRETIRLKPDDALAHCTLRRLLQKKGEYRDALAELRHGHEVGSKQKGWSYPSDQWMRDAERMVALESRFPAVIRGDDKPKDGNEALEFGSLAYESQQFSSSARLYSDAFRADPKLADDMTLEHRYLAASSGALASAGKGVEKPPLDEKAKTRWRNQALDWLKADLAHWSKQAASGMPENRALVTETLEHWKADTDLASVRDEEPLRALTEPERKACQALWAEVDKILKQVKPKR
jgi:tetratricopeptide (TPR) repeat protein/serine/threonine protein kinase